MIKQHFVATYQQMGDFEVVNVNGKLKKNGGDVASYFCTPEARVVHAVGKAVAADRLMQEALWALDTYREAMAASKDVSEQARLVSENHLTALNVSSEHFVALARAELPKAQDDFRIASKLMKSRRWTSEKPPEILRVTPEVAARVRAANRLSGRTAHKILAARPLASLDDVSWQLFERLTGERANEKRGLVFNAAEALQEAKQQGTPVLLVFYNGRGESRTEYDSGMRHVMTRLLKQPAVATPLRSYRVVAVPIRQLPALSNLVQIDAASLPPGRAPTLVVATPAGESLAMLSASNPPAQLASYLWPQVHRVWLTRAAKLAEKDDHSAALRLLRQVRLSDADSIREQAIQRINDIQLDLAAEWSERGNRAGALRLLQSVRRDAIRDDVRSQADRRIAELADSR